MILFKIKTESNSLITTHCSTCYVSELKADEAMFTAREAHFKMAKLKSSLLKMSDVFVKQIEVVANSHGDDKVMPIFYPGKPL